MKAQTFDFNTWITETDPEKLKQFENILRDAGFGIIDKMEYYFKPQGYSALYLLAESHLAIHTFPEEGCSSIQLSSCVKGPYIAFLELFIEKREKLDI